jgi:hypothetical protein
VVSRLTYAAAAALVALTRAQAQDSGIWEISAQAMHSVGPSTSVTVFDARAAGVTQSAFALRASTNLLRLGPASLRYSAQLLPVIRLGGMDRYTPLQNGAVTTYVLDGTRTVYGVGVVPLGLELGTRVGQRVRLQAGAGIGIAGFTQHVPYASGRRTNVIAEWDGALQVHAGGERWVQLGARWRHLSNGNTAWENPGIDNRMLFAGVSWRVRAPR